MKNSFTFILLIFIANQAVSQTSQKYLKLKGHYKYEEGYILDSDSVKVKGLFNNILKQEKKGYTKLKFMHEDGTKRNYKPNEIVGFGYSTKKFVSDNKAFYELYHQGRQVSLYRKFDKISISVPMGPGMGSATGKSYIEVYYVKRPNENIFKAVTEEKFKEEFSTYFKDCEEIANDILTKELTYKDIQTIVRKYNYCN